MITHPINRISSCTKCHIRSKELFADLAGSRVREELTTILHARRIPEGEIVFREGDAPQGVIFIDTGRLKLTKTSEGQKRLVKIARPDEILGLGAILTKATHHVTAEALEPTTISVITPPDFRRLLRRNAFFLGSVLSYLEGHAHRELTIEDMSRAAPALSHYLVQAVEDDAVTCEEGIAVHLPVTLRELSFVLNLPFDQVNQALTNLEDRQWAYRRGMNIIITDLAALKQLTATVPMTSRAGIA